MKLSEFRKVAESFGIKGAAKAKRDDLLKKFVDKVEAVPPDKEDDISDEVAYAYNFVSGQITKAADTGVAQGPDDFSVVVFDNEAEAEAENAAKAENKKKDRAKGRAKAKRDEKAAAQEKAKPKKHKPGKAADSGSYTRIRAAIDALRNAPQGLTLVQWNKNANEIYYSKPSGKDNLKEQQFSTRRVKVVLETLELLAEDQGGLYRLRSFSVSE